ncbi:hypothetical protein CCACVL1_30563 [Corchorus capsularis]|uniref:N-alpha-acetyltransferase 40 n=1 Tax=Corchorus capsularis TaxID=210143 RepID=A0A1R3FWK3_COCAP|nr:hypothetical protein CCACVL1_30563 [Corchorus capsularis]
MNSNRFRVSLTTDTWTSIQKSNYMCVTAHYVDDDWKLVKRIISFYPISGHKGEMLGKALEKCLKDWGLDTVFCVTVDNATNNDVVVGYLKKKFLKEKEFDSSVGKIREAVKFVRASNGRSEKFMACAKEEKVKCDKDCALMFALGGIALKVSGTSYVTSSSLLDEVFKGQINKMNMIIYVASILDPRKKLSFVDFSIQRMYNEGEYSDLMKTVQETTKELFEGYKTLLSPEKGSGSGGNDATMEEAVTFVDPLGEGNEESSMDMFWKHEMESGKEENRSELDVYLKEDLEKKAGDFDVLGWWKMNSPRFPILSCMARDVLAVHVSTVASESAFSTGGRVLDVYRSRLNSKFVQALVCGQDWLRGTFDINLNADMEEQSEFDQLAQEQILERKKTIDQLIKAASAQIDHLDSFPPFRCFNRNGLCVRLESGRGDKLSPYLKQCIQNLLKANMEAPYGSQWAVEEKVKRREMVAPEARYIFLHSNANEMEDSANLQNPGPSLGFIHYRFTLEEDIPVLYLYEIQLDSSVQGKGLGKFLMQLIELIARKVPFFSPLESTVFTFYSVFSRHFGISRIFALFYSSYHA